MASTYTDSIINKFIEKIKTWRISNQELSSVAFVWNCMLVLCKIHANIFVYFYYWCSSVFSVKKLIWCKINDKSQTNLKYIFILTFRPLTYEGPCSKLIDLIIEDNPAICNGKIDKSTEGPAWVPVPLPINILEINKKILGGNNQNNYLQEIVLINNWNLHFIKIIQLVFTLKFNEYHFFHTLRASVDSSS